MANGFI